MLRVGLHLRKLDFETVDGSAVMQLHGCFSLLVTAASRYLSCSAISNNLVWTVLLKLLHHHSDHAVPLYHYHYLQPKHSVDRFFNEIIICLAKFYGPRLKCQKILPALLTMANLQS